MAKWLVNNDGEVKALFDKFYKGNKNIMTPDVLEYGTAGELIYEISSGEFLGKDLYGLTLLETNPLSRSQHTSLHYSMEDVGAHLDKI
jgi:hypothetical protein